MATRGLADGVHHAELLGLGQKDRHHVREAGAGLRGLDDHTELLAGGQGLGLLGGADDDCARRVRERGLHLGVTLLADDDHLVALVGEAMSALCVNAHITEAELSEVQAIFNSFGKAEVVPESLIDAVVGVSGSSPAYVYLFIEAMADAAVADGMPRAQAYKFAAQSVYGAAKMVLETGRHPGELKDAVCSPGGTTIEAVAALERGGLRDTVITAQRACSKKSHDMSTAK